MAGKNKISLSGIDNAAESKGSFMKTLWQFVKFIAVGLITYVIQVALAYLLPLIFDHVTALLPQFLQVIFKPDVLFDVSTSSGAADYAKYVVGGVVTWGYVLPFFLSNFLANIYAYIQNKRTTFRSDAPKYCFAIYIILMICLILFSTWFQGFIYGLLTRVDSAFLNSLSRFIASICAGAIQFFILFPVEKFVLLKERKKPEDEADSETAEPTEAAAESTKHSQ